MRRRDVAVLVLVGLVLLGALLGRHEASERQADCLREGGSVVGPRCVR